MKASELGPSNVDGKGQHIKQMVAGHKIRTIVHVVRKHPIYHETSIDHSNASFN